MTAPPLEHPEKQRLIAFGMGKLAPEEATQIEQHLEGCPDCCETILDLQDDTFVGLLRQCELPVVDPDQTNVTLDFASGATAGGLPAVELPRELREHGRYEIQELIGRGGMGDVYKAQHRVMNRPVALKVIRPELVKNSGTVLRFHREVQAAARLHHGNIVAAYDAEQAGDAHYLVMEFVDGVNLDEVIRKSGPLPVEQACDYIRQAAAGLQHAHELGMVHRDIKPANLFVSSRPNGSALVKVLDFGIATAAAGSIDPRLTSTQSVMGSPSYMSPEQLKGARDVDARSDIWSLGVTLYELITGNQPFTGNTLTALSLAIVTDSHERPANMPASILPIIDKCLEKDREDRYQNVTELAQALAPLFPGGTAAFDMVRGSYSQPVPPTLMGLESSQLLGSQPTMMPRPTHNAPAMNLTTSSLASGETGTRIPASGSKKWMWIAAGAVTIMVGVGVGIFVGRNNENAANAAARPPAEKPPAPPVPDGPKTVDKPKVEEIKPVEEKKPEEAPKVEEKKPEELPKELVVKKPEPPKKVTPPRVRPPKVNTNPPSKDPPKVVDPFPKDPPKVDPPKVDPPKPPKKQPCAPNDPACGL